MSPKTSLYFQTCDVLTLTQKLHVYPAFCCGQCLFFPTLCLLSIQQKRILRTFVNSWLLFHLLFTRIFQIFWQAKYFVRSLYTSSFHFLCFVIIKNSSGITACFVRFSLGCTFDFFLYIYIRGTKVCFITQQSCMLK